MKTSLKFLVFIAIVFTIVEVGMRSSGKFLTGSEIITGEYFTNYDKVIPDWYDNWTPNDTFTVNEKEFTIEYQTNKQGFREKEFLESDSSKYKIFFLGDSFTEGFGANYDSTFVKQIERRFHEDSISTTVYNWGRAGSDPFYNYTILRDLILPYQPTHVVFCTHNADVSDVMMRGGFERFQEDGTTQYKASPWFHTLYKHSHIVRMLVHQGLEYDWRLVKTSEILELEKENKTLIDECLFQASELCKENEIKFMAVSFVSPWDYCYNRPNEVFDLNSYLDSSAARYNVIQVNQHELMSKTSLSCEAISWPIDRHYKAVGYQLLGDCIYDKLKQRFE